MIHGKEMVATGNNNNSSLDVSVRVRLIDLPLMFGGAAAEGECCASSAIDGAHMIIKWSKHDH